MMPGALAGTIQPFDFHGHQVRVITDEDGEHRWVAADVADILGLGRTHDMVRNLDDDERGTDTIRTLSGEQEMTTLTEAGLYACIIRSRKPEAREFRRWITHEVLPSIRKRGGYLTPEAVERTLTDPDFIIRLATDLKAEREKRAVVERKNAALTRHKQAIEGGDGINPTDFGKKYFSEVPAKRFQSHLYKRGWQIDQRNTRKMPDGTFRDGYDHGKPTAKGRPYFYNHDGGNHGGRRRFSPRIRPQMEIELRDHLAAEGLPVNEHSTGLVLISNDEMKELGA